MSDNQKLDELAAVAFTKIQFESIEVVDRVRDLQWENDEYDSKPCQHGEGSFFAVDVEDNDADSAKFSFHCLIQEVQGELKVVSAYVYDCKTGNEVATLEVSA